MTIISNSIYETCGHSSKLVLCNDAKIMLAKNVDTSDQLVNGAICVVKHIAIDPSHPTDGTVYVKFADAVGREARKSCQPSLKDRVIVNSFSARFNLHEHNTV